MPILCVSLHTHIMMQRTLALEQHREDLDEILRSEREERAKKEETDAIQEIKLQHTVSFVHYVLHKHVYMVYGHILALCSAPYKSFIINK